MVNLMNLVNLVILEKLTILVNLVNLGTLVNLVILLILVIVFILVIELFGDFETSINDHVAGWSILHTGTKCIKRQRDFEKYFKRVSMIM